MYYGILKLSGHFSTIIEPRPYGGTLVQMGINPHDCLLTLNAGETFVAPAMLFGYTTEGFDLFDKMLQKIDQDITIFLIKAEIRQNIERKAVSKNQQTNEDKSDKKQSPKKVNKIGRNELCTCGSGKKYKNCCGK